MSSEALLYLVGKRLLGLKWARNTIRFDRIPLVALVRIDCRGQGGWEKGLRADGETCIEGRRAKTASGNQGCPRPLEAGRKQPDSPRKGPVPPTALFQTSDQ